ncbi:hypothetical protein C7212DRAFT_365786 [Tuber magnatum]|uniref:NB-ARC domain-containing protein n=1 Tax=Tuber magnatum TaxID=42249 RepID=A0A317SFJ7_9PEZI|nr:hypothetical protein C7212DRAFT_365786 [Tuber magnatum]
MCFGKKEKPQSSGRGNAWSEPEDDGTRPATRGPDSAPARRGHGSAKGNQGDQPGDDGPRMLTRSGSRAHAPKSLTLATRIAESHPKDCRPGVMPSSRDSPRAREPAGPENINAESQLEDYAPGVATSGGDRARARRDAGSEDRNAKGRPRDGRAGTAGGGGSRACAMENPSLGGNNAESPPEDGGLGAAPGSCNSARTRRNLSPVHSNAEGQLKDYGPGLTGNSNTAAHAQEKPGSANGGSESRPGDGRLGMVPSSNTPHARKSPNLADSGGESHAGDYGPGVTGGSRAAARGQEKLDSAGEGAESQGSGRLRVTGSSRAAAPARKKPDPANEDTESRPEDGGPGVAPISSNSVRTRKSPSPANSNAESQPRDYEPGIMGSGSAAAHAWEKPDSANEYARRSADSSSTAAHCREEPGSANRNAEGNLRRSSSKPGGRTSGGTPSQPRGRGNPGGNPEDLQSHENVQATGESECQSQTGTDGPQKGKGRAPGVPGTAGALGIGDCAPGDSGSTVVRHDRSKGAWPRVGIPAEEENMSVSQIRTWPDTATTGYVYQRYSPDRPARPPDEEEGSTGNQIADEARDIFCSGPEPAMREEGRGTHDTDPINTSVELGSAEGSFRCNSGNQNNYGANNRKAVNEGTIVNQGTIVNLMGADGGDRLRITAVAAIEEAPQAPWMVTYCQNRGFTGREDILRRIEIRTQTGDHDRVALWGLGGTGYGHTSPFTNMGVTDKDQQNPNCLKIRVPDNESLLTLVKKWFESPSSGEWILVVDNADNESDFDGNTSPIARYIPRGPKGTLIVTTRSKLVASRLGCHGDNFIKVERMKPVEAKQLFLFRYGVLKRAGDERVVGDILRSLHYLPLAVVGAAAYMTETSTTPSQYYRMLKSKNAVRERLLSQEFNDIYREAPAGVAESILSTFFITFRQINERYHQAMDLLRLITFLKEHQNIPEDVLRCSGLTGMDDDFTVREIIGKLESFSLVTEKTASSVEDQSLPVYELHRLVQISAEVYFKKREGLDVSIWMGRARSAEELASRARLPPISSQGPQDQPDSEIEQPDQECV